MNATVQCLRTVPELREALKKYQGGTAQQLNSSPQKIFLNMCVIPEVTGASGIIPAQSITAALRDLYTNMDKGNTIPPIVLLQVLHMAFPIFAEKNEQGSFAQQVHKSYYCC